MKRYCSIMGQLLQCFDRTEFQRAVRRPRPKDVRGFSSWDHFVSMLFCQIADAQSLRQISGGLASCEGKLEQFGITAPKKSTLAYANTHRPWRLFERLFYITVGHVQQELGSKTRFRFKNPLKSFDSSVVTLCSEIFSWATWSRQKGAVKLHLTFYPQKLRLVRIRTPEGDHANCERKGTVDKIVNLETDSRCAPIRLFGQGEVRPSRNGLVFL
jgi:hypothetical protein